MLILNKFYVDFCVLLYYSLLVYFSSKEAYFILCITSISDPFSKFISSCIMLCVNLSISIRGGQRPEGCRIYVAWHSWVPSLLIGVAGYPKGAKRSCHIMGPLSVD